MFDKELRIIIFYGPPCSGKSSLCEKLSKSLDLRYLSTDSLRLSYFIELKELYREDKVAEIYALLFAKIQGLLSEGVSVIVEGLFLTNYNKEQILKFSKIARITFIYVIADWLTLQNRLALRNKHSSGNILQHREPLSTNGLRFFYERSLAPVDKDIIVDTSDCSIDDSYDKVLEIIDRSYSVDYLKKNVLNAAI